MNDNFSPPGDSQTPAMVDAWVRQQAQDDTVMVLRLFGDEGYEYHLVEVTLSGAIDTCLHVPGFGKFSTSGFRSFELGRRTRILIPLPDVVQAAIDGELWVPGSTLRFARQPDDSEVALVPKLWEQAKARAAQQVR